MKCATDRPMHQVWFAQSLSPARHCLVFAFALVTSSTPCEKSLRSCTFETQIMHFGHTRCFLSALCYSFVAWLLSLPLLASTFATSSAQIETKFKDKEAFKQWLTAFGRHQVKNLCDRALWRHRRFLVCPLLLFRLPGFCRRLCLPPPSPPALHKLKTSSRTRKNWNSG